MKTKKLKNNIPSNTDLGNKPEEDEKSMREEVAELKEVVIRIEALIAKLLEVLPFHK
jgi:hypothetical protein